MPPNGSKFEHACFISYKHPPRSAGEAHFYREFVEVLCERLNYFLGGNMRTYADFQAETGSSYPTDLPQRLCRSVCMIAVLVLEYPDSNWCQAEWDAMEILETKRGRPGLIIPIALRGSPDEWNERYKRKPVDFSKVSIPNQLYGVRHSAKIKEIADMIAKLIKEIKEPCEDCGQFQFNLGAEEIALQPTFKDPEL